MTSKDTFHQVSNLVVLILGALAAFDWTTFVSAATAGKIIGALALGKLIVGAVATQGKQPDPTGSNNVSM